jgi:hypothetical protein
VVVGEKLLEHRFEMAAAKDHQVIEQLSACGAHPPFRDRIHERRSEGVGVRKVHERRPTSSPYPLQGRHPQTIATLLDSVPTVLSQVTAACPVFLKVHRLIDRPTCADNFGSPRIPACSRSLVSART